MKSKLLVVLISIFMCLCIIPCYAENFEYIEPLINDCLKESVPVTSASNIYVINIDENIEIFSKNADNKINPAGTAKLMTAYTAYKLIPDLDVVITASESAVKSTKGLNAKIKAGESYKARDLFYALLIGGANDAANILAEYCCGSIEDFVSVMNENAIQLGANNTHYTNPTGLHDDGMYTTAYDTAIIAKSVYYINTLLEMTNTISYELKPTNEDKTTIIRTRNRLLANSYGVKYYNPNAKGISYSSTDKAGHCLITTCVKGGLSYLIVVMNGGEVPNNNPDTFEKEKNIISSYIDANSLIDYCMNSFSKQVLLNTSKPIYELEVKNSATFDHVILYPEKEIQLFLPKGIDIEKVSFVPDITTGVALAPVNKGDVFGTVSVVYNNSVCLYTVNLVSDNDIERSGVLYILYIIESFIKSKFFITLTVIAVLLIVLYFALAIYLNIQIKHGKYRHRYKRKR